MPISKSASGHLYYENRTAANPKGTIIFIHGSGGTAQVWHEQMQALSKYLNCLAIDLPGHGKSSPPAYTNVGEAALHLKAFIEKESLTRPIYIAGHSLGAAVTLHYARYYAVDLNGFILIGGGAKLKVLPQILESLAIGKMDNSFFRMTFSPKCDPALIATQTEVYMQNSPAVLYADFNACDKFDLTAELSTVTLPALIIVGRDDILTPVKYAEYLQTHLPEAVLVILETAGHFAMLEQPAAVNQAIFGFLKNLES